VKTLLGVPLPTAPTTLHLSEEAQDIMEGFSRWIEPQLSQDGDLGGMTDWAGKLAGAVARIAGCLHVMEQELPLGDPLDEDEVATTISADALRRAVKLGEYLLAHAKYALSFMGTDHVVEDARYILGWIHKREVSEFTQRDVYIDARRRFDTVAKMNPALDLLVIHGYLREITKDHPGPGRKPSPRFRVNPQFHSDPRTHNTHNTQNEKDTTNSSEEDRDSLSLELDTPTDTTNSSNSPLDKPDSGGGTTNSHSTSDNSSSPTTNSSEETDGGETPRVGAVGGVGSAEEKKPLSSLNNIVGDVEISEEEEEQERRQAPLERPQALNKISEADAELGPSMIRLMKDKDEIRKEIRRLRRRARDEVRRYEQFGLRVPDNLQRRSEEYTREADAWAERLRDLD
jgi:Protein of unknown function (DUF3987)